MPAYSKKHPETIKKMFATIASDYDRTNQALSMGLHKRWNQALIDSIPPNCHLLDLCSGTGEIALGYLAKHDKAQATLLDFSPHMLAIADEKGEAYRDRYQLLEANAELLPLNDMSVDHASVAYGIRNVNNPHKCFSETYRVLRYRGTLSILELTRPKSPFLSLPHALYLKTVLPLLGKKLTSNKAAYDYLRSSIQHFATPRALEEQLKLVGFSHVEKRPLWGGIATLLVAAKL